MASLTAVELGADTCAIARTTVRRGEVRLLAAETLDPAAFPGIEGFTSAVRRARKALMLPRRCRAVVWGLPDGATKKDPAVKPLIAPLIGAGFRVERVISPCNALAALARLRTPRGEGASCWVAVNRSGVAMVVVRPGKQLYSHSFAWDSSVGSSGSQARLLQRYTLVAFLAPEIRRAMAAAREKGTPVGAIVTCGNLPEIRSLTMPLIEELDVEVEALDSLEGLVVKPDATAHLLEVAASLRIACAGAIARPTRPWVDMTQAAHAQRSLLRFASAGAVILAMFVIGWGWWTMQPPARSIAPPVLQKPAPPATQKSALPISQKPASPTTQKPAPPVTQRPASPVTQTSPPPLTPTPAPKPTVSSTPPSAPASKPAAKTTAPAQSAAPPVAQKPAPSVTQKPAPSVTQKPAPLLTQKPPPPLTPAPAAPKPTVSSTPPSAPASKPAAKTTAPAQSAAPPIMQKSPPSPQTSSPSPSKPAPAAAANAAALSDAAKRAAANAPPFSPRPTPPSEKAAVTRTPPSAPPQSVSASIPPAQGPGGQGSQPPANNAAVDRSRSAPAPSDMRKPASAKAMLEPLKDPVPRVTAILVSSDRRLATVDDGRIITIGDVVGKRVVVDIDERAVVLREPSGVQIRVGLGGRIVRVERTER